MDICVIRDRDIYLLVDSGHLCRSICWSFRPIIHCTNFYSDRSRAFDLAVSRSSRVSVRTVFRTFTGRYATPSGGDTVAPVWKWIIGCCHVGPVEHSPRASERRCRLYVLPSQESTITIRFHSNNGADPSQHAPLHDISWISAYRSFVFQHSSVRVSLVSSLLSIDGGGKIWTSEFVLPQAGCEAWLFLLCFLFTQNKRIAHAAYILIPRSLVHPTHDHCHRCSCCCWSTQLSNAPSADRLAAGLELHGASVAPCIPRRNIGRIGPTLPDVFTSHPPSGPCICRGLSVAICHPSNVQKAHWHDTVH